MNKIALMVVVAFSACWALPTLAGHHKVADILVDMPYVRALVPGQTMTAAFFRVANNGAQNCVLTAATSAYAEKIEFHTHQYMDGMMKMRPVEAVELPAGSSQAFKPGGLHLMLFGVKQGDNASAEITLITDKCGELSFLAPIKSIKSMPAEAMHH